MIEGINVDDIYKVIYSLPRKDSKYLKGKGKRIKIKDKELIQFEFYTDKQAFHYNIDFAFLSDFIEENFKNYFLQVEIETKTTIYSFKETKKGKILSNKRQNNMNFVVLENDKKKEYLLEEGKVVPPLVDLGVMTEDGRVVKAYADKYKQINRFLSIIEDTLKQETKEELNIIDFGCGKSYLTFIVYYYLTYVKKIHVNMIGLDLKSDVIKKCNQIRDRYNYTNLNFLEGNVEQFKSSDNIDMIITLHACDTATDYALFHAINLNCKYILSVPCCQHEINNQLNKDTFKLINKYGLVKDRFSAILTDSIRCNLLEYKGYAVKMLEFVDFEQTPKNILIRAIKTNRVNQEALSLVEETIKNYNIKQTLFELIKNN